MSYKVGIYGGDFPKNLKKKLLLPNVEVVKDFLLFPYPIIKVM